MYAVIPAVIAGGGFESLFRLSSGEPLHLHFLAPILAPLSLYSRHAAVAEAQRLGLEVLLLVYLPTSPYISLHPYISLYLPRGAPPRVRVSVSLVS